MLISSLFNSPMVQTLQARSVTLADLEERFGLNVIEEAGFFQEWQVDLPEITTSEKQQLDKIRRGYWNLIKYPPFLERAVQVSILGPLFFLADFFLPPFHIRSEKSIEVAAEDQGVIIRGQIDILLLKDHFWALAIESKEAAFSIETGLAQLLVYMLANPNPEIPSLGLITSGGGFIFVKLVQGTVNQYALSRIFELRNPGNELYEVFRILKKLGKMSLT